MSMGHNNKHQLHTVCKGCEACEGFHNPACKGFHNPACKGFHLQPAKAHPCPRHHDIAFIVAITRISGQ